MPRRNLGPPRKPLPITWPPRLSAEEQREKERRELEERRLIMLRQNATSWNDPMLRWNSGAVLGDIVMSDNPDVRVIQERKLNMDQARELREVDRGEHHERLHRVHGEQERHAHHHSASERGEEQRRHEASDREREHRRERDRGLSEEELRHRRRQRAESEDRREEDRIRPPSTSRSRSRSHTRSHGEPRAGPRAASQASSTRTHSSSRHR